LTALDSLWRRARLRDRAAFTDWVRAVEGPLRRSLGRFARAVDTEAILQEGLLRMWTLAPDLELQGEHASLRYAYTLVANLAKHEARRIAIFVPLDEPTADGAPHPEPAIDPEPPSDPALSRAILDCIEKLPRQPRRALGARLENDEVRPDRDLAEEAGMKLNTFHQNIVHARRHLAQCLEGRGVRLSEVLR
jgi:DNA-directed RNA polymerase specialized sigma24 family protein